MWPNTILVLISFTIWANLSQGSREVTKKLPGHGLSDEVVARLENVRDRGVAWLMSQMDNFGWSKEDHPEGTVHAVIALASSVDHWPTKNDLVANLVIKQLEIELLDKLLRKESEPLTPEKIAFFALALTAACKDPKDFHGHNLVASLEKHYDEDGEEFPVHPESFGYSFTSLVSCLSGSHLNKRSIKHLIEISKGEGVESSFSIDTRGIALLALECVRNGMKREEKHHHHHLVNHMHESLEAIGLEQREDGSFGNVQTNGIAIQALAASWDHFAFHHWNKTAAAMALASTLENRNDPQPLTLSEMTESLIAVTSLLNGLGILKIKGHCRSSIRKQNGKGKFCISEDEGYSFLYLRHGANGNYLREEQISSNATNTTTGKTEVKLINVRYHLWLGPEPSTATRYNLTVDVPFNRTFYFVMQRAAEIDPAYEFTSNQWPNGHYIRSISGKHQESDDYHFWLLYKLRGDPDPQNPPSTEDIASQGVDDLRVNDGDTYLFWFKNL